MQSVCCKVVKTFTRVDDVTVREMTARSIVSIVNLDYLSCFFFLFFGGGGGGGGRGWELFAINNMFLFDWFKHFWQQQQKQINKEEKRLYKVWFDQTDACFYDFSSLFVSVARSEHITKIPIYFLIHMSNIWICVLLWMKSCFYCWQITREKMLAEENAKTHYEHHMLKLEEEVRKLQEELGGERQLHNKNKRALDHLRNHFASLPLHDVLPPTVVNRDQVPFVDHIGFWLAVWEQCWNMTGWFVATYLFNPMLCVILWLLLTTKIQMNILGVKIFSELIVCWNVTTDGFISYIADGWWVCWWVFLGSGQVHSRWLVGLLMSLSWEWSRKGEGSSENQSEIWTMTARLI